MIPTHHRDPRILHLPIHLRLIRPLPLLAVAAEEAAVVVEALVVAVEAAEGSDEVRYILNSMLLTLFKFYK